MAYSFTDNLKSRDASASKNVAVKKHRQERPCSDYSNRRKKINFRGLFNALKVNFYPFAPCKNLHLPNKALVCYYIIKSVLMYIVHCTGALVVVGSPGREDGELKEIL